MRDALKANGKKSGCRRSVDRNQRNNSFALCAMLEGDY